MLVILRHAKAHNAGESDLERSLTRVGWTQAEAAARAIAACHFHVNRVLCSPAMRARETLIPLRSALHIPEADIIHDQRLYNAGARTVAEVVSEHLPAAPLLVVGHNPGLEQLASWLAGRTISLGTGDWVRLRPADELVEGGAVVVDGSGPGTTPSAFTAVT